MFSTLAVTPPLSIGTNGADLSEEVISPIAYYQDASDVEIITLIDDGVDWAGGTRGAALFLTLLVLTLLTVCCCGLLVAIAW